MVALGQKGLQRQLQSSSCYSRSNIAITPTPSQGAWRYCEMNPEMAVQLSGASVSNTDRDFFDTKKANAKKSLCLVDSGRVEMPKESVSGVMSDQPTKVTGGDMHFARNAP
jgi:hypothetical protein